MATVPIPNTVQVTIDAITLDGSDMANVLNFNAGHAPTAADVEACVSIVDNWITTDYVELFSSRITVQRIIGKSRHPGGNATFTLPVSYVGELTGVCLPYQCSAAINVLTPYATRRTRGLFYAFCPDILQLINAKFTQGYVDDCILKMQLLRLAATGQGFPLGVASPTNQQIIDVSGFAADTLVDMRRSRKIGVGT